MNARQNGNFIQNTHFAKQMKGETVFSRMHELTLEEQKPFHRDEIPRYGMCIRDYEV